MFFSYCGIEFKVVDSFFDADILFLGGTAIVPKIHENLDELLEKGKAAGYLPISASIKKRLAESDTPTGDTTGCGDNFTVGVIAELAIQLTTKNVGELNLLNACAWGISSGGFACFYPGGVYHETTSGEKNYLIKPYADQYLQQIRTLFNQGS
jgi:hypothetical protein